MKISLKLLIILLSFSQFLSTRAQFFSEKVYQTESYSGGLKITATQDGNFVIAVDNGNLLSLLKVNELGDTIWSNVIDEASLFYVYEILETDDRNFIVEFRKRDPESNMIKKALLKTDSLGIPLIERSFEGTGPILEIDSGNFLMAGSASPNPGISLTFLDSELNVIKKKWIQMDQIMGASELINTTDGNYLIAGSWFDIYYRESTAYALKINSVGDTLWTCIFDWCSDCYGTIAIEELSDNYTFATRTEGFELFDRIEYLKLHRLNSEGELIWSRSPAKSYEFFDVIRTQNEHYQLISRNIIDNQSWLIITSVNDQGDPVKERLINSGKYVYDAIAYQNHIVFTGYTFENQQLALFSRYPLLYFNPLKDTSVVCGEAYAFHPDIIYFGPDSEINYSISDAFSHYLVDPDNSFRVFNSKRYSLIARARGLIAHDSMDLDVQSLQVDIEGDTVMYCGDSVHLHVNVNSSSTDIQYTWMPENQLYGINPLHPVLHPSGSQNYTVLATDSSCITADSISISVLPAQMNIEFLSSERIINSSPFVGTFINNTPFKDLMRFTWYFGDGDMLVSNDDTVTHEYESEGLFDITLTAENLVSGCMDSATQSEYLQILNSEEPNTGLESQSSEEIDRVVYDPQSQILNLSLTRDYKDPHIFLTDVKGQRIIEMKTESRESAHIHMGSFPPGVYFIFIYSTDLKSYRKFIKAN